MSKRNTMTKLSIIVPYYNGGHYVSDVLEDLLQQDFRDDEYEIIVVDDGSTESVEVLKSYCERYPQIVYFRQENKGVSVARNQGVSMAKGEYLFFCDCDDRVRRHSLNQVCEEARRNDLQMLFFNHQELKDNVLPDVVNGDTALTEGISSGVDYYAKKPFLPMGVWHFIISKELIVSNDLSFPELMVYHEDLVFLVHALLCADKVSYVNTDIYYYIQRPESAIHYSAKVLKSLKVADNRMWIIKDLLGIIAQHPYISCKNSLQKRVALVSFQMLHHSFRYLSVRKNRELISQLRQMGVYPFKEGRYISRALHITYKLMQIYPLWMACCCIYHLFPESIRQKF